MQTILKFLQSLPIDHLSKKENNTSLYIVKQQIKRILLNKNEKRAKFDAYKTAYVNSKETAKKYLLDEEYEEKFKEILNTLNNYTNLEKLCNECILTLNRIDQKSHGEDIKYNILSWEPFKDNLKDIKNSLSKTLITFKKKSTILSNELKKQVLIYLKSEVVLLISELKKYQKLWIEDSDNILEYCNNEDDITTFENIKKELYENIEFFENMKYEIDREYDLIEISKDILKYSKNKERKSYHNIDEKDSEENKEEETKEIEINLEKFKNQIDILYKSINQKQIECQKDIIKILNDIKSNSKKNESLKSDSKEEINQNSEKIENKILNKKHKRSVNFMEKEEEEQENYSDDEYEEEEE